MVAWKIGVYSRIFAIAFYLPHEMKKTELIASIKISLYFMPSNSLCPSVIAGYMLYIELFVAKDLIFCPTDMILLYSVASHRFCEGS